MQRLAAAALLALLAACGGEGSGAADDGGPADTTSAAVAEGGEEAAPVLPPPGTPWSPEDSAAAVREDSLHEARLMATRQASMDSYEACVRKAEGADPQQRAILEAACRRGRSAPDEKAPR